MNIGNLIQKAVKVPTDSTSNIFIVTEGLLAPIKKLCQIDNDVTSNALHYLSMDLKRKNGGVRMRALYIINELFQRSKLFRKEIALNMNLIVACGGFLNTLSSQADPPPATYRSEVENKVKELIEMWDTSHGKMYPEIHTAARFLKETLRESMPNLELRRRQSEADASARQEQAEKVLILQSDKIINELKDTTLQVNNILERIEECFNILFPRMFGESLVSDEISTVDEFDDNFDDIDWIEHEETSVTNSTSTIDLNTTSSSSSSAKNVDLEAVGAVPYAIEFTLNTSMHDVKTADNEILISIIQELSKQLINHIVPRLMSWKTTLTKSIDLVSSRDSATGHKRKLDNSNDDESHRMKNSLSKVKELLSQIHSILIRKCKELFRK